MGRESKFEVSIRVSVTQQMCVSALTAKDAEKLAHGMFSWDDVDAHRVHQETVGPIVECLDLECSKGKLKPWALVENAGMDDEHLVDEFATFALALKCKRKRPEADIMRRASNHSLTTEF